MLKITKVFVLILMFSSCVFNAREANTNKIIYLISPVAFLRMMQARGDFVIVHEPSQLAFDSVKYPHETHDWFLESAPQNFEQVKKRIFNYAHNSSVFVKEISFAVKDFLKEDEELAKDSRVHFVFLLRNPHHAAISFYKKCDSVFLEDAQDFSDLIGYKAAYELYKSLSVRAVHKPLIILSEMLYTAPEETIKHFCHEADITYKPEALIWPELDTSFDGQEWHEIKQHQLMHHWHGDALRSGSFAKPAQYHVDENGQPTFVEIVDKNHREICKKAYSKNKYYYELLLESID